MAKSNGHQATLDTVVEALHELGKRIDNLGERLDNKIDLSNAELILRLDRLIDNTGTHYRNLEKRIEKLERKAG